MTFQRRCVKGKGYSLRENRKCKFQVPEVEGDFLRKQQGVPVVGMKGRWMKVMENEIRETGGQVVARQGIWILL